MSRDDLQARLTALESTVLGSERPTSLSIEFCHTLLGQTNRKSTETVLSLLQEHHLTRDVWNEIRKLSDLIEAYASHGGELSPPAPSVIEQTDPPASAPLTELLADPKRRNLVRTIIGSNGLGVMELATATGVTTPTLHKRLAPLVQAGVIDVVQFGHVKQHSVSDHYRGQIETLLEQGAA